MRTVVAWTDRVPDRDGIKSVVNDVCFRPDGSQLVAAVGNRVLVYDAVDGDLLHSLKVRLAAVSAAAVSASVVSVDTG
jgi:intraflagellar transport protein 122